MPGAFKLTNLTIFHKRHKILPSFLSAGLQSTSILRPNHWWRRRPSPSPNFSSSPQILHCRKSYAFFTSDSRENRHPKPNFVAPMRAIVNGKLENKYFESSDVSPPPSQQQNPKDKPPSKLLTLPTILTIGRVASVPLLVGTFYAETWWGPTATTGIFIAAAFTDWLDGYLARKMNVGTPFGAFLDPVADKLMVAATLILLCTRPFEACMFGNAPWLLTVPAIAIIGREITMSAVREWAASQDRKLLEAVAVNNLGKWKTATQMIALTILLASRDKSFVGAGALVSLGVVLLYISAWLSLWSLAVYMKKIWKVLLR